VKKLARHTEMAGKGGTASREAGVLSSAIFGKEATAPSYEELRLLCEKKLEPHKLSFKGTDLSFLNTEAISMRKEPASTLACEEPKEHLQ
jgi:hypothetical protein